MKHRGRKGPLEREMDAIVGSTNGQPSRTPSSQPVEQLSGDEAEVFDSLMAGAPPNHFEDSDQPLLAEYARAICQADRAAEALQREGEVIAGEQGPKQNPWCAIQAQARKAMATLSMRLRLSPQARRDRALVNRPLAWGEQRVLERSGQRKPWEQ